MSDAQPGFGDNVRIRVTPETEAAGVAGLRGQVYGETTPSVTEVRRLRHCSYSPPLSKYEARVDTIRVPLGLPHRMP